MADTEPRKTYLCTRCKASNTKAEDHETEKECRIAWQGLAAQSVAAVQAAKKQIRHHQKNHHLGFKVHNRELNICSRCLIIGFTAYEHVSRWFDIQPKTDGEGGLVDVPPPMPLPAVFRRDTPRLRPLPPPLVDAPPTAPGGGLPPVAPGPLL